MAYNIYFGFMCLSIAAAVFSLVVGDSSATSIGYTLFSIFSIASFVMYFVWKFTRHMSRMEKTLNELAESHKDLRRSLGEDV